MNNNMTIKIPTLYASPLSIEIVNQTTAAGSDMAKTVNAFQKAPKAVLRCSITTLGHLFSTLTPTGQMY